MLYLLVTVISLREAHNKGAKLIELLSLVSTVRGSARAK